MKTCKQYVPLRPYIKSSPSYPCSSGASNARGERVELCVTRIFSEFRVRWCGWSVDVRVLFFAMVASLMRWSFES
jgi:hypothetical protein